MYIVRFFLDGKEYSQVEFKRFESAIRFVEDTQIILEKQYPERINFICEGKKC